MNDQIKTYKGFSYFLRDHVWHIVLPSKICSITDAKSEDEIKQKIDQITEAIGSK